MSELPKDPAAVTLGRKGGKRKVPKGFSTLTPEQRRAMALKAVAARQRKRGTAAAALESP